MGGPIPQPVSQLKALPKVSGATHSTSKMTAALLPAEPLIGSLLPFTKRELDSAEILKLSKLDAWSLLEKLRNDHGIVIVPVDCKAKGLQRNSALNQLFKNPTLLGASAEVARYYSAFDNKLNGGSKDRPIASFIAPYAYRTDEELQNKSRPFHEKPVVLVTETATRDVILHEAAHFLLQRDGKHTQIEGLKVDQPTAARVEYNKLVSDYNSLNSLPRRWLTAQETIDSVAGKAAAKKLLNYELVDCEEIEVHRFMIENRAVLKLQTDFVDRSFRAVSHYMLKLESFLNNNFEELVGRRQFVGREALIEKKQLMLSRWDQVAAWYDHAFAEYRRNGK